MSRDELVTTSPTTTPDVGTGRQGFGQMTSDIAVYYGMDGDAEKEAFIKRIIHDVIDDLNTKKLWQFNLVTSAPITVTPGSATYTVPTDLWSLYSVRKTSDIDYTLTTMSEHSRDIIFSSQNGIRGFPYVNAVGNIYRNGTLSLFPIPDAAYTLVVRYFSLILKPTADTDTINMPTPYQVVPKYGALARLGAMTGQRDMAVYWEAKFQEAYNDMDTRDEDLGDEDLRWMNIEEGNRLSYTNPNARPRWLDLY